ncbi:hypothetical protein SAMN05421823_101423 [Catalinimonas alkaloidigena]|uniref:Uncharacterized protein n=2 Tax=Catalinimonas alkaloidigena TaxID=1075417 RepID=A0A1G8XNE4_9BACT|nr:hypothetical protein SAMN05421823_101423 [Catalinimonas alkaloidigena]
MWHTQLIGQNENARRYRIQADLRPLTFAEVLNHWETSEAFRAYYLELLADAPFEAFYWEHPGLLTRYLGKPYEFVLLRSASLATRPADAEAFAEFFDTSALVVDFENLGKNARLIAPTPRTDADHYKFLASFVRHAPKAQQHALFQRIGHRVNAAVNASHTLWLNTAGMGVIWLHVRLDSRPKYYKTQVYKRPDFLEKVRLVF